MSAFENVFGRDYAFTMTTPKVDIAGPFSGKIAMHPPQRHFDSFAKAADECGLSRVYLGIHFRYDSEQGVALGRLVGAKVVDNFLQPLYSGPWPLPQRGRS
jgi:alkanesulfonate monooxygenase SsuD/methylene tetrahydromethanopterin reductase-like flavin-dependent oxidoreductase (luciferase family)